MASYKVEICGVNTSTLPILKESEKKASLCSASKNGDLTRPGRLTSAGISVWFSVSSGAFPLPMKMWMICFRLAALV